MRNLYLVIFLLVGQCQKENAFERELLTTTTDEAIFIIEQQEKAQIKTIFTETKSEISKIPLAGKILIENENQIYLIADGFESDLLQIKPGMLVEVHTLIRYPVKFGLKIDIG